jgi:putative membrane protein
MQRSHSFTLAAALAMAFTGGSLGLSAQTSPPPSPADRQSTPATGTQSANADAGFVQQAAASGKMEVEHGKMAAQKASNAQVKSFANRMVKDHTAANEQLMALAKAKKITIADRATSGAAMAATGGAASGATGGSGVGSTGAAGSGSGSGTGGNTGSGTSATTGTTGASGGVPTTGEAARRQQQSGNMQPSALQNLTGAAFDKAYMDEQVKAHESAVQLFDKQANGGQDAELKAFAAKQLPTLREHLKMAQDIKSKLGSGTQN